MIQTLLQNYSKFVLLVAHTAGAKTPRNPSRGEFLRAASPSIRFILPKRREETNNEKMNNPVNIKDEIEK